MLEEGGSFFSNEVSCFDFQEVAKFFLLLNRIMVQNEANHALRKLNLLKCRKLRRAVEEIVDCRHYKFDHLRADQTLQAR